jgi:hypothetical protein
MYWSNMNEKTVVDFPVRYEAEIALAERSSDLLAERLATGKLPEEAVPKGDISALIDAVGELLHLDALENAGRSISEKKVVQVVEELESAAKKISSWPPVPRTLAIAALAEMLEEFELEWIALDLLMSVPALDFLSPEERMLIGPAIHRIVPLQMRIAFGNGDWTPEFEDLLRYLRDMVRDDPDDEELHATLTRGLIFHAIHGREALAAEHRRALVAAEPLPVDLGAALSELADEASEKEILTLSLHLVLADAIAAGLVPEGESPRHVAAAALVALVRRDEPDERVNVRYLARWAKASPRQLESLARRLEPVFEWAPADFDGPVASRQQERWRMASSNIEFMPARWVPAADAVRPPYTEAAARERLQKLRDVVWLMVDPLEAVRFVSESFEYGGDAPDEVDVEVVRDIIGLWKKERLVSAVAVDDEEGFEDDWDEDDDWDDESPDGPRGFPTVVTTDGEPLVFSTAEYEVADGHKAEIVRRLDAMEKLHREQDDGTERWVWLEPRDGGDLVIAGLSLEDRLLKVETQSVARAARVGAELAQTLGDLVVLLDLHTEKLTPEMLMRQAAEAKGGADSSAIPPEEQHRVVLEMLERHYRSWPDEDVPALGNVTPREAVADPELRPDVIRLLLDFEQRNRSAPGPLRDFDFAFLWDELGLDRNQEG